MKRTGKKSIKIVAATSMAIFSLFTTFTAAYAWYTSQRKVNDDMDSFAVEDVSETITKISVHDFYGKSETDFGSVTTNVDHSTGTSIPSFSLSANTKYVHIKTTSISANALTFTIGSNSVALGDTHLKDIDGKSIDAGNRDFVIDLVTSGLISNQDITNAHTLATTYTNGSNDFSITISRYETPYFTFNPEGRTLFEDGEAVDSGISTLGEYSLEDPDHPLLMLFKVDGWMTKIDFATDYPFLGNKKSSYIRYSSYTKSGLASISGMANGDFAEVLTDESNDNKTTLYKYDDGIWTSSLYNVGLVAMLNDIDKTQLVDGDYILVTEDMTMGGVSSLYKYVHATKSFQIVWIDLGINDESSRFYTNPLSSVCKFSCFEFENDITEEANLSTLDVYERNNSGNLVKVNDVDCIAINSSEITTQNTVSFADCSDFSNPKYYNEICVYDGNAKDCYYIGVVINYNALALEYIFSNNLGHEALSYGLKFYCDWVTKV